MSADVVDLAARRWEARAKATDAEAAKAPALSLAIQADIGGVRLIAGNTEDGLELYLSPEQAFSVGVDLWNAARAAKEAQAAADEMVRAEEAEHRG